MSYIKYFMFFLVAMVSMLQEKTTQNKNYNKSKQTLK